MIAFDAVSLCLNNRNILKNISFRIRRGETVVLVGSSGAGKSTILRLILGLMKPTNGRIFVLGKNIVSLSERQMNSIRRKFGLVFQSGALFDSLTLEQNVGFFLTENSNLSAREIRERVDEIMKFFGLENFMHYYPSQISGGMKKRVAIARAVITQPEALLYDEPTAGLDPLAARKVVSLISQLQKSFNMTSLIVTHEIHHFANVADRLLMLKNGTITYDGVFDLAILDEFEETETPSECIPNEVDYADIGEQSNG
ncbi:MAG: ATP-binding cassette domain-containing protein [candidate division KSB1 bacterium]|nr:ATP-binding cassette domain-containing protein [candidate division KSB1 bacterium]